MIEDTTIGLATDPGQLGPTLDAISAEKPVT